MIRIVTDAEDGHTGRGLPPHWAHGSGSEMESAKVHNDAYVISSDVYVALANADTPGGVWELGNYEAMPEEVENFAGRTNPPN